MAMTSRTNAVFCFSSRRRHTRYWRDWSSDVCSSDLARKPHHRQVQIDADRAALDQLEVALDQPRRLAQPLGALASLVRGERDSLDSGAEMEAEPEPLDDGRSTLELDQAGDAGLRHRIRLRRRGLAFLRL